MEGLDFGADYSEFNSMFRLLSQANSESRTFKKFLCHSDLSNLWFILNDIMHSASKPIDVLNAVRRLSDAIQEFGPPLANDVCELYAAVMVAIALLYCQYLKGLCSFSRAVSSGSLDYRDTFIAIVLFRGAYVWIKFRDVASTKRIPEKAVREIKTSCKDGRIKVKYEPRFKPRKENGETFSWIYLGHFDSSADAEIVYRMAASCYDYGKGYGTPLDLAGDGRELFAITPEFTPAEKTLSGRAKQELVKERVQELYKRYKTMKDALNLPPTLPGANLEQELENRRLQSEILSGQQQKEDLARQLQQSQNLQQEQMRQIQNLQQEQKREIQNLQQEQKRQIQNLQLEVEKLQRQVQDQQPQQNLQHSEQFQVPNLQPPTQLPHLQQQQREESTIDNIWNLVNDESTTDNFWNLMIGTIDKEPSLQEAGIEADIDAFLDMESSPAVPGFGAESTNSWRGGDIHN